MTEIQIPYLPSAQFFKILCRLGVNEPDVLGDSDSDPQIRTIGGTVSISAMVPRFRYTEADGRKRVVYTKNETYNIDTSTGELVDADGNLGVNLLNTNSPQMDPQGWTYKATIRPSGGDPFDAFIPSNPEGGVYDLGDGLVFTPSTGITSLETRVKALEDAGGSGPGAPENFDESVQDIVGAMVAGAGGTYDDATGTIVLPSGGGGTVSSVAGRTGIIVLSSADLTDAASLATDAELSSGLATKADAVHEHTSANIADWAEAVQDTVAAMLVSGANVTLAYDDAAGKVTVTAVGGDAEVMRDTIGAALVGVGGVSIAINDEADTITLSLSGVTSVQISDSTAIGRSLLTAADAAAAREAIGAGTSDLELATTEEALDGVDTTKAVTPAGLKEVADTKAPGEHDHDDRYVRTVNGTSPDGNGDVAVSGGGGGGSPAKPTVMELFPREASFTPSGNNRLATHWNPADVTAGSILLRSFQGSQTNDIYQLLIYKATTTKGKLDLVYATPEFAGMPGEAAYQHTTPGLVIPRGLLYVGLILIAGTPRQFVSGTRSGLFQPNRDHNNSGGVEVTPFAPAPGWTPPSQLTTGAAWAAPPVPMIAVLDGGIQ